MWQAWTNAILGMWLFVAAFLSFSPLGNLWDNLIVGVIAASVGFSMYKEKAWQGWLAIIMGIWLVIAAFIPILQAHTGNLWNDMLSGVLLMVAGFGAMQSDSMHHSDHQVAH